MEERTRKEAKEVRGEPLGRARHRQPKNPMIDDDGPCKCSAAISHHQQRLNLQGSIRPWSFCVLCLSAWSLASLLLPKNQHILKSKLGIPGVIHGTRRIRYRYIAYTRAELSKLNRTPVEPTLAYFYSGHGEKTQPASPTRRRRTSHGGKGWQREGGSHL